ncbi:hypothetical protein THAOC_20204 [Thalassiosira oceanica]|uniref:Uncharacterized protein n=1 Tax=Thalassiosira oceanica TaxID=159749 RepID=K0S3X7_THAOC|nr:hypothetical protein THAOC_20204 [Thalassiosira oceanica]|eukprot:EJK59554.1 hypothetical protein THAOC_20204 [Thalassiosira oceanica]
MGEDDDTKAKDLVSKDASGGIDKNAKLSRQDSIRAAKTNADADVLSFEPEVHSNERRSTDSDSLDPELIELIAADLFDQSSLTREFKEVHFPHETRQNRIPPSTPTAKSTSNNEESIEPTSPPKKRSKISRGKGKKVTVNAASDFLASTRGSWIAPQVHAWAPPISSTKAQLSQEYILHHQHLRHNQSASQDSALTKDESPSMLPEKAQPKF